MRTTATRARVLRRRVAVCLFRFWSCHLMFLVLKCVHEQQTLMTHRLSEPAREVLHTRPRTWRQKLKACKTHVSKHVSALPAFLFVLKLVLCSVCVARVALRAKSPLLCETCTSAPAKILSNFICVNSINGL